MAWSTGTITSATPVAALSQKVKDLISGGSGIGNWSFVKNIPAGTSPGQSGSASYSVDLFRNRGATTLYDRLVQKNLANSQITTDGTSFIHTITTPPASRFITVLVVNSKASAADDPTSVALDGSNAPTFTKIKSQASGATGILKSTLWIGKSSASAPTGTQLTVTFGATQTGCMVIVDEWQGPDLTLGATTVDPTGVAQIGIQVVGANGTTETAHTPTLAAFLGAKSCAIMWAAETASATAYTTEQGWTPLAADLAMATPTVHARGQFRPDQDDTTPTLTSGGTIAEWCAIAFEIQRKVNTGSVTNPNDAGIDWYFMIEIPVTDNGTLNTSFNCAEDYDGNELFRRMPPTPTALTPVSPGGWRDNTLTQYNGVPGNNRGSTTHQILNTTGFSYWIKMTPNLIIVSTRVGAAEKSNGAMLLDSFCTNAADMPLMNYQDNSTAGNSFSRLPGVATAIASQAFQITNEPWTVPVVDAFTTNAAGAQDLWSSNKIHVSRCMAAHSPGRSTTLATTIGYARGLYKTDLLIFAAGGTVQLGDTMTIAGNTWTVVGKVWDATSATAKWIMVTRAT